MGGAVWRALVIDPLPRHAGDVSAFGALAFDQPRGLPLAAVRHRVKFGMRVRSDCLKDWRQKPFKRFALGGRSHLAFEAKRIRHLAEGSFVTMLHANARMDQFMRQDAGYPHAVGNHRRD
jgi:hypothetical protein